MGIKTLFAHGIQSFLGNTCKYYSETSLVMGKDHALGGVKLS